MTGWQNSKLVEKLTESYLGSSIGSITVLYNIYQYFTFRNLCSCGYDWTAKNSVPCEFWLQFNCMPIPAG